MKYKCKINYNFIQDIDMYGRKLELYFNGKARKTSCIGLFFTFLYISIFLAFFIYKLKRVMNKKDGTFNDTYAYTGQPPSIKLSNENFYGGFALEDPETYDTFIDETIYFPKAYYKKAERYGNNWEWSIKELELERCQLEKFGSHYRDIFKRKPLNDLYCFKEMNETLIGHFSYDIYSLFFISFFPCVNTTENNNKCKPLEVIDYYIKDSFVSFEMQDIELTPQNYNSPALQRDKDFYTKIGKKIFQEMHTYFQIVNIETETDFLGFNNFDSFKSEKFLKYDSSSILSNIADSNIYETGNSFCNVTLKLSDKVLTQRRRYTKLLEILGNIGGLMEVLFTLFKIISSFPTKILYEEELINNLFQFNLDKEEISLISKEKKYIKKNNFSFNPIPKIYIPSREQHSNINNNKDKINKSKNSFNENFLELSKRNNDSILMIKSQNKNNGNISFLDKYEYTKNKKKLNRKKVVNENDNKSCDKSDINIFNFNMSFKKYNKENDITNEKIKGKRKIIRKIKINKGCIYFCFFCVRKRKNLQNVLLDEGMKIIVQKLDLLNLFRTLFRDEKNNINFANQEIIKMSNNCKNKIEHICNSLYNI